MRRIAPAIISILIAVPSIGSSAGNSIKTVHFDLNYKQGMENCAVYMAQALESGYSRISDYLEFQLNDIIAADLNHDAASCHAECPGSFDISISYRGSYTDAADVAIFKLSLIFMSGLRHDYLNRSFGIRHDIPAWFRKAFANYMAYGFDTRSENILFKYLAQHGGKGLSPDNAGDEIFPQTGQSFLFYLEERFGNRVPSMVREYQYTGNLNRAFSRAYGYNYDELVLSWREFYLTMMKNLPAQYFSDDKAEYRLALYVHDAGPYPAISPDSKRLVAVNGSSLLLRDLTTGSERTINLYGRITLEQKRRDKNFSWDSSGALFSFTGRQGGIETLYIADFNKAEIVEEVRLPFVKLYHASLSKNGKQAVFAAATPESSNIYLYDIQRKKLSRITDDHFDKAYPCFLDDNAIVYSSNENSEGNPFAKKYSLIYYDISKRDRIKLSQGAESHYISEAGLKDSITVAYYKSGSHTLGIFDMKTASMRPAGDFLFVPVSPRISEGLDHIDFLDLASSRIRLARTKTADANKVRDIGASRQAEKKYTLNLKPDKFRGAIFESD